MFATLLQLSMMGMCPTYFAKHDGERVRTFQLQHLSNASEVVFLNEANTGWRFAFGTIDSRNTLTVNTFNLTASLKRFSVAWDDGETWYASLGGEYFSIDQDAGFTIRPSDADGTFWVEPYPSYSTYDKYEEQGGEDSSYYDYDNRYDNQYRKPPFKVTFRSCRSVARDDTVNGSIVDDGSIRWDSGDVWQRYEGK